MKLSNTFLFVFAICSSTSALEQPQSFAEHEVKDGIKRFLAETDTCSSRLESCIIGSQLDGEEDSAPSIPSAPWGVWLDYFRQLDGDPDPLYVDLIDSIQALINVDFSQLISSMQTWLQTNLSSDALTGSFSNALGNVLTLLTSLAQTAAEFSSGGLQNVLQGSLQMITNLLQSGLGPVSDFYNNVMAQLMNVLQNIEVSMPASFGTIMDSISVEVIRFTSVFLTSVVQLVFPPEEESSTQQDDDLAECLPNLLDCQLNTMANEIMPTIVGSAVTVKHMHQEL